METSPVLPPGPWSFRTIAANGARFGLAELGEGRPVLLLHGFPTFWWTWRHQMVTLAEAGYRAVAMDLRGYGSSDKTPRGYDPTTLSGDVAGVIRSLGFGEAVVVGHGWGGLLAWTSAVLQPKVVERLVVVSAPHPRRLRAGVAADRRQLAASRHVLDFQRPWAPEKRLVRDDGAHVEELLRAWGATPGWPDAATAARYRAAMRVEHVAHCSLEYYRWMVRSLVRPDGQRYARRMLAPIQCPVLQVHGGADPAMLPSTAAGSGHFVTGQYSWCLLPDVGHFPHEEAPEAFDAAVLRWLRP